MEIQPSSIISFELEADTPTPMVGPVHQLNVSRAELAAMFAMPGGPSVDNWLLLRGIVNDPVKES